MQNSFTSLFVQDALGQYLPASDDVVIAHALATVDKRMRNENDVFHSPLAVKQYLSLKLGQLPYEVFAVLYLDSQHRLLSYEELFRGTLTQTSVYPREVVKRALELNASACILSHNHPSASLQPSRADEALTQTLKSALALVDVRILDHIIVGAGQTLSMAEQGLV